MALETKIAPIDWDSQADQHLEGVGGEPVQNYRKLWHLKQVNVFAVLEGPGRVGTLLVKWETTSMGDLVAVVVALGGAGESDLVRGLVPEVDRIARMAGAVGVRLHTRRAGMVRKLAKVTADRELMIGWIL